jgi:hypothetical protein
MKSDFTTKCKLPDAIEIDIMEEYKKAEPLIE